MFGDFEVANFVNYHDYDQNKHKENPPTIKPYITSVCCADKDGKVLVISRKDFLKLADINNENWFQIA